MNLLREVAEKVNRPFPVKLAEAREIITHHFEEFGDKVAVAFSGGKDSEVVVYLCLQANPSVQVIFNNTGVEYPETVHFVNQVSELWGLNLLVRHPEKTFWECVEQYGFPQGSKRKPMTKSGNRAYCCYWLKEKPMHLAVRENNWLGYFDGVTAVESWTRMFNARDYGSCFHFKKWNVCKIRPILWWTEDEVWGFIHDNNLPFNAAYSRGAKRIGCMPCTAYSRWEEQMAKVNPKMYRLIKLRKDNQYVMPIEQK